MCLTVKNALLFYIFIPYYTYLLKIFSLNSLNSGRLITKYNEHVTFLLMHNKLTKV